MLNAQTVSAQGNYPQGMRPATQPMQGYPIQGRPIQIQPIVAKPAIQQLNTHQALVNLASTHPICLVVGEGLASSFVGTNTTEEGPFQDFVMGAQVSGMQKTNARTSIDFTPDPNVAKMLFVLKGITANQTTAVVSQATIHSAGTFEFEMTKQIEFNGQGIRTWSPSAFLTIRQKNLGASTPVSQIPLLGPLANNIVMNAAEQRKPMSEGIAAQRVTQQVAPQFNSRLDAELAKLNDRLNGQARSKVAESGLAPSRISTTTTHDALLCGLEFQPPLAAAADSSGIQQLTGRPARTMLVTRRLIPGMGPTYGSAPGMVAPAPYSMDAKTLTDRACLLIHASLIENLAERFKLGGREISDTQLQRMLGTPSESADGNAPQMYTLVLAKENPLTAFIDDGELVVSIRASIRLVLGPEIPTQVVTLGLRPTLNDDQITLKPELRSIEALNPDEGNQLGSTTSLVIRQAIVSRLKEYQLNREYEIPRQNDRPSFPIRIQSLTLVDGWISATLEQPEGYRSANAEDIDFENFKIQ